MAKAAKPGKLEDRIVDTAIAIAEEAGWDNVRLREVAAKLKVPLGDILGHYRDLDGVADAWFGRALAAMAAKRAKGFFDKPPPERLHSLLMNWFDALAGHRRVTGEMLATKMYPAHPHHWAPMIFNLSRTIQWLRDAAGLDAGGVRRQVEEIGLTTLFLATLSVWVRDGSEDQSKTRDFLRRKLGTADRALACCRRRT